MSRNSLVSVFAAATVAALFRTGDAHAGTFEEVDYPTWYDGSSVTGFDETQVSRFLYKNVRPSGFPVGMDYRLWVPADYDPSKKYPVFVYLHGFTDNDGVNERQIYNYINKYYFEKGLDKTNPCLILMPSCPDHYTWHAGYADDWYAWNGSTPWGNYGISDSEGDKTFGEPIRLVKAAIDKTIGEYSVDRSRIYVGGFSMGGFGTWNIIAHYPDLFAAAIPCSGGGDTGKAQRIKDIPIWCFHGGADNTIAEGNTWWMYDAISNAGGNIRYTKYRNTDHCISGGVFCRDDVWSWMFAQRRSSAPADNLMHRWRFDGSLKDDVTGREAEASGCSFTEDGKALHISTGVSSEHRVMLPRHLLPDTTGEATVEFFFKVGARPQWTKLFFIGSSWDNSMYYSLRDDWNDYGCFGVNGNNQGNTWYGNGYMTEGYRYHVSCVVREKDGVTSVEWHRQGLTDTGDYGLQTLAASGWKLSSGGQDFVSIGDNAWGNETADLEIEEVRVWNRALTKNELHRSNNSGPDAIPDFTSTGDWTEYVWDGATLEIDYDIKLSDGCRFIKTGGGTLVLKGANSWTGDTRIEGGSLHAALGRGLPASSHIVIAGGAWAPLAASYSGIVGEGPGNVTLDWGHRLHFLAVGQPLEINFGGDGRDVDLGENWARNDIYLNFSGGDSKITVKNKLLNMSALHTQNFGGVKLENGFASAGDFLLYGYGPVETPSVPLSAGRMTLEGTKLVVGGGALSGSATMTRTSQIVSSGALDLSSLSVAFDPGEDNVAKMVDAAGGRWDVVTTEGGLSYGDGTFTVPSDQGLEILPSDGKTFSVAHPEFFGRFEFIDREWRYTGWLSDEQQALFGSYSMTDEASGLTIPYRQYVPKDYDPNKKYPVLLFLHGLGENGTDNVRPMNGAGPVWGYFNYGYINKFPCIIIVPQCPERWTWQAGEASDWNAWNGTTPWGNYTMSDAPDDHTFGPQIRLVKRIVDKAIEDYAVDTDRIYVTGLSCGGFGTWNIISHYPDFFAAATPICGGGDYSKGYRLVNLPIWCFHGENDTSVNETWGTWTAYCGITDCGGKLAHYTKYKEGDHFIYFDAYGRDDWWNWLFSQKKRAPNRPAAENLVHRYRFDGDAKDDVSGLSAGVKGVEWVEGKSARLAEGPCGDSFIGLPVNQLPRTTGEATVEFFFKINSRPNWAKLFYAGNSTSDCLCFDLRNDNSDSASCSAGGTHYGEWTNGNLTDGKRYYVAGTIKSENGVSTIVWRKRCLDDASDIGELTIVNAAWTLENGGQTETYIGRPCGAWGNNTAGIEVEEFRVWDRVFSAEEIAFSASKGPDVLPDFADMEDVPVDTGDRYEYVAAGETRTISDSIFLSEGRTFYKTGGGTLYLTGDNEWSGDTVIYEGTLAAELGKGVPSTSHVTMAGGAWAPLSSAYTGVIGEGVGNVTPGNGHHIHFVALGQDLRLNFGGDARDVDMSLYDCGQQIYFNWGVGDHDISVANRLVNFLKPYVGRQVTFERGLSTPTSDIWVDGTYSGNSALVLRGEVETTYSLKSYQDTRIVYDGCHVNQKEWEISLQMDSTAEFWNNAVIDARNFFIGDSEGASCGAYLNGQTFNAWGDGHYSESLIIGRSQNSKANLNLASGSFNSAKVAFVGAAAGSRGSFNQFGGTSTFAWWASVGRYAGAWGDINVSGGSASFTDAGAALSIGEEGEGYLNVIGPGSVSVAGELRVGCAAGAKGGVAVRNGGTLSAARIYSPSRDAESSVAFDGANVTVTSASALFENIGSVTIGENGAAITIPYGATLALSSWTDLSRASFAFSDGGSGLLDYLRSHGGEWVVAESNAGVSDATFAAATAAGARVVAADGRVAVRLVYSDPSGRSVTSEEVTAWLDGAGAAQSDIDAMTQQAFDDMFLLNLNPVKSGAYALSVTSIQIADGVATVGVGLSRFEDGVAVQGRAVNGRLVLYASASLAGGYAPVASAEVTNGTFSQGDSALVTIVLPEGSSGAFYRAVIE